MNRWMTVEETAEYLGVAKDTVYVYISNRTIPFARIPGSRLVRFDRLRLDQWLEENEVASIDNIT